MRLKFVALTSLITAIVAAVLSFLVVRSLNSYGGRLLSGEIRGFEPTAIALSVAILAMGSVVAAILVYRRTSRKRKTQAATAAIAVPILAILTMYALWWLFPLPPITYSPPIRSPSAPASKHQLQTECAHPV